MDKTTEPFPGINYLLFCDETKFYKNAGDLEDEIYYVAVMVHKEQVKPINDEFVALLNSFQVQAPVFHATTIFKTKHPRKELMDAITALIIKHRLPCYILKYHKELLFEPTKQLSHLNSGIHNFNDAEYQALFYFHLMLNTELRDKTFAGRKENVVAYFDRNVYGKTDVEAFVSPHDEFVIKRMTYTEKSKISLVALPDFFGYIFRKSKLSHNRVQAGDLSLETDRLTINSNIAVLQILDAGLFHFLEMDIAAISVALGINFDV